ncbi:efflux RND transporter periplasmic adaptor subunit [Elongatibacter sediminis]|uniref:Efflux RND transporter periplasmic adaptor subunit n=1 Tax=Elongatibacter sediminis TaxID=3119006 RepID=A0AAW9R555_9GAMM
MIRNLALMLVFLGIVFGGIFGWKYHQAQKMAGARGGMAAVVSTQPVREESWQAKLPSVGTVTPTYGVVVSSEVAGIVRELGFDSGATVKAGDLLVQLDAEVDIAEAAALEAERKLAELTRDRLLRIVNENLGSRSDLDEAEAHLEAMRAQVAAKQATINKKSVRAPFDGKLGIRTFNRGHYLGAGEEIVELVALDPIYVDYTLPERYLAQIEVGQDVIVQVAARPGQEFKGTINAISPSIERATRSVPVRAEFANPEGLLRPGMFADVTTVLPARDAVVTLPERAITYNPYGDSVFVVEDGEGGQTVRRVQVRTGNVSDGRVEILSGLEPGMEVVTDGHNKLRNGQPVTVDNSSLPDENQAAGLVAPS